MKKLINDPANYVDEVIEGMSLMHPETYTVDGETSRVLRRTTPKQGKVGVVSGGGFGHLPLFAGYIGDGLLDACAIGDVFASSDMNPMLESVHFADTGKGVLCIVGNYGGDRMNFDMTREMAEMDGIETTKVIVADDVASASAQESSKRRGVGGLVYVFKIAGAVTAAGQSLEEATKTAQKASDNCRSIGVALSSCIVPQAGKATFEIADDEVELGMGIHGEPGVWRGKIKPVNELVDEMVDYILKDMPLDSSDRVSILVNGLGATPIEELYLVFRRAKEQIEKQGVTIVFPMVGNYATSMEMAGASLTVMKLDNELESLLAAPADCPFWRNLK